MHKAMHLTIQRTLHSHTTTLNGFLSILSDTALINDVEIYLLMDIENVNEGRIVYVLPDSADTPKIV